MSQSSNTFSGLGAASGPAPASGPATVSAGVVPLAEITGYHAHIYYGTAAEREQAACLRERIGARFPVQLGRWRDAPVGPHPRAMYQVAFACETFALLVPWLMLNRLGLTVLVHPNTDNPRADHLRHALWLGEVLPLRGESLPTSLGAAAHTPIEPNTTPGLVP